MSRKDSGLNGRLNCSLNFCLKGFAPFVFLCLLHKAQALDLRSQIFYELFVRSFQDSNGDGNGDLAGLTSRLSEIKSLGADGIWLTPIFPSPSYHGYDATDYKSVQPQFGTLNDFKTLIETAHNNFGLKVILDIAVNHTSNQNPWFLSSQKVPINSDRTRYLWQSQDPHWPGPDNWNLLNKNYYYGSFGPTLPDLNWINPLIANTPGLNLLNSWQANWVNPVTESVVEDLLSFWAGLGVDGFRLDAARYYVKGPQGQLDLPGTHAILHQFTTATRNLFPNVFFVGEVWANSSILSQYLDDVSTPELDLAFNFPFSGGLIASLQQENATALLKTLQDSLNHLLNQDALAPFLTNHDMDRLATQLNNDADKLRLAATALFAMPGTPFIYYGEELGLVNGSRPGSALDKAKRTPMPWNESKNHGFTSASRTWEAFSSMPANTSFVAQLADQNSLLNDYKSLVALRHQQIALQQGKLILLDTENSSVLGFLRSASADSVLVLINFSRDPQNVIINYTPSNTHTNTTANLWASPRVLLGSANVFLAPSPSASQSLQIQNLGGLSALYIDVGPSLARGRL